MKYIVFVLLLLFANASSVHAHILRTDGQIGVTVHIDPDDQPVSEKESTISVDIQDRSGRFDPANPSSCVCTLSIYKKDAKLADIPISTGHAYNLIKYTFPTSGTYMLEAVGKPNGSGNSFQAFATKFEYYVKGEQTVSAENNILQSFLPYGIVLVSLIIVAMFFNPLR